MTLPVAVGCAKGALFDPTGRDVTLQATWLLAGEPATPERCKSVAASAGETGNVLERVVLVFLHEGFEYSDTALDCRCDRGGFDSRTPQADHVCSEARLRFGSYEARWAFLDRDRSELGRSEPFPIDAREDGPCAYTVPAEGADGEEKIAWHCALPDAVFPQ